MGQDDGPFKEQRDLKAHKDEAVYDFDTIHKWDDILVKGIGNKDKIITWGSTNVASHKGVTGKSQNFYFSLDAKMYEDALSHPDMNRGVVLMSGDARFPLLHCWLRPFSTHGRKLTFTLSIPVDRLGEMYVAFIPKEGKRRYLYKLDNVVLALKDNEVKDNNK